MAEHSLKDKTVKGVGWSALESVSVQGVQFFITIVIARILSPKDFGLVGMLTIFIAVSQTFVNSGFPQALIRRQARTDEDSSTVFYFNIVISVIVYVILFLIAPYVAVFFNEPQLVDLMRVLCLIVIINAFSVVQRAHYTASINFKTLTKSSLSAALTSGIIGIWLAYSGFGVWTLVYQQLTNAFLCTCLLWWFSSWRPRFIYSWRSFRELFSFGSKLLASGLMETIYNNLYQLVIGKVFSSIDLGYYSQAQHFANLPSTHITGIVQRVTYPILCSIQEEDDRLKTNYCQLLRLSAFVIFPIMCLVAGMARPLVLVVLGEKWLFSYTLIIPLCFTMMWFPIHAINLNLLQVKGRSDLFLKIEIAKKIIGVLILVIALPFGLTILCWGGVLNSIISLFLNTYYTGKLIRVGFFIQMKEICGTLIASLLVFFSVYLESQLIENSYYAIVICLFSSVLLFLCMTTIFHFKEIDYIKSTFHKNNILK